MGVRVYTFHAAGDCRQHFQNCTKFVKNVNIFKFCDHIWNHHGKCIQISTNMYSIGLVIFILFWNYWRHDEWAQGFTLSMQQAIADNISKIVQNLSKMLTVLNFVTIFGITMENAFK